MISNPQAPPSSPPKGEIPQYLTRVSLALDQLAASIANLQSRVGPVCNPELDTPRSDKPEPCATTDLGKNLASVETEIIAARARVDSLIERIEL